MAEAKHEMFRFDSAGTLRKPGPIGRLVRLGMGVFCLGGTWMIVFEADLRDLFDFSMWAYFLFALWLAPAVVNIGWGRLWGMKPRYAGAALGLAAAIAGWIYYGTALAPPMWWVVRGVTAYTFGHLGLSFVLSALIGTPGCEMRAIPHLLGIVSGRPSAEHYCPGFIDNVDRWESKWSKS